MISPEPADRYGVIRWPSFAVAQQAIDRESTYRVVGNALLAANFSDGREALPIALFCRHLGPLVTELLWHRDRIALLERKISTLKSGLTALRANELEGETDHGD